MKLFAIWPSIPTPVNRGVHTPLSDSVGSLDGAGGTHL